MKTLTASLSMSSCCHTLDIEERPHRRALLSALCQPSLLCGKLQISLMLPAAPPAASLPEPNSVSEASALYTRDQQGRAVSKLSAQSLVRDQYSHVA